MPIRGVIGRAVPAVVLGAAVVVGAWGIEGAGLGRQRPIASLQGTGGFVDAAAHPSGRGVYLLTGDGRVETAGSAVARGSLADRGIAAPAVELVPTPSGGGYWIFDAAGGVHAFGDAPYLGSPVERRGAGAPILGGSRTPTGLGYLALDAVGGVHAFGDAPYLGSLPALRAAGAPVGAAPAVDVAVTPSGAGYLVLDAEGGIFTFGDAGFLGSIPALRAAGTPIGQAAVRDLVVAPAGGGYWVTDSAGGIFAFGQVAFHGSAPALGQAFPLVATAVVPDGSGYWMMAPDGALLAFGSAMGTVAQSAPPPPSDSDRFTFIEVHADGSPVRFNPCRAIPYAVHVGDGAPANATGLVAEAFARISAATGISFVDRGLTGETFSAALDRPLWNHPAYGSGPSPVLVSFERPNGANTLGSRDAGVAGRQAAPDSHGHPVVVTGSVAVNTTLDLVPDFSNAASYGAVLLHELGHVMGLDHVDDPRQIMSGVLRQGNPGSYQHGDLAGLAGVGTSAGCTDEPPPR